MTLRRLHSAGWWWAELGREIMASSIIAISVVVCASPDTALAPPPLLLTITRGVISMPFSAIILSSSTRATLPGPIYSTTTRNASAGAGQSVQIPKWQTWARKAKAQFGSDEENGRCVVSSRSVTKPGQTIPVQIECFIEPR